MAICLACFYLSCLYQYILQGEEYDNAASFVLGFLISFRLCIIILKILPFASKATLLSDKKLQINSQVSRHGIGKVGSGIRESEVEVNERG